MVKILIVNGYKDKEDQNYLQFKKLVQKVNPNYDYKKILDQKDFLDTEVEFFFRDNSNLNDIIIDFGS